MRPCHHCRSPVENSVAACPHCGTTQADGPNVNSETSPPRRGLARSLLTELVDLVSMFPALALPLLILPLVIGGGIGHAVAGWNGTIVGVVATIALGIGAAAWAESGR